LIDCKKLGRIKIHDKVAAWASPVSCQPSHPVVAVELMILLWGIRLCIMVRKAPSEFNESRFISMTIYNEFLLSIFLNVSMFFLQHPANPDLLYIIFFCHSQLTITILLCLIFASKVGGLGREPVCQPTLSVLPGDEGPGQGAGGPGPQQQAAHGEVHA
jgi:hypothetical protein